MGLKRKFDDTVIDLYNGLTAAGEDLGSWGIVRKPRGAVWSAIDTIPNKRQKRMPMRVRNIRKRTLKRRYTKRRRPMTRKKRALSFKKRVQRVTFSLAESKRYQTRGTLTVIADATQQNFALAAVPETTSLTALASHKNLRMGTEIRAQGCRTELHFQNTLASTAIWIRVIWGYKKYNRSTANKDDIFLNPLTEVNEELTTSLAYPDLINATIDRRQFTKVKDIRFRLGGSTESTSMENFRSLKWWWPMKGKSIKFEGFSEGQENQTYDPFFLVYAVNETGATTGGNVATMSYRTMFYFKDI